MIRRPLVLYALTLALVGRTAHAAEPDPWWGQDKALHFGFSIGLGALGYAGSAFVFEERWQRAAAGGLFSITLGAGKEFYDLAGHGDPSWRDFTWDLLGTAAGVGLAVIIDLTLFPDRKESSDAPASLSLVYIRF